MTHLERALALALAACVATPVAAAGLVEDYHVNAQYRGAVKKGFRDLGTGKAAYESLGGNGFRVRVKADVEHPKDARQYAFDISRTFQVNGNDIRTTATEKEDLNENARPHASEIEEIMPFAYLSRTLPPPAATGGDRSRSFTFNGQSYELRYADTEKNLEISLYRGSELVGKFFEDRQPSGSFARLEKFRMPMPSEDLVVSFITTNSMASAETR